MDLTFSGLLWWGAAVGGVALLTLVVAIPAMGCLTKDSNTKTEFFSSRACYWGVVAGLALMIIAAVGRTVAYIVVAAKGR